MPAHSGPEGPEGASGPVGPEGLDEPGPGDRLARLLHAELRAARRSALDLGADPREVTADITGRVRRLRELNAGRPPAEDGR